MFCPKCGALNANENTRCISCGHNLSDIPDALKGNNEPSSYAPSSEAPNAYTSSDFSEKAPKYDPQGYAYSSESTDYTVVPDHSVHFCTKDKKPQKVKDYFVWAIISAILFNIAFGAASIIFSGMTQAEIACGNRHKAEVYSSKTKLFCTISLVLGIIKFVYIIAIILIACATKFFWHFY